MPKMLNLYVCSVFYSDENGNYHLPWLGWAANETEAGAIALSQILVARDVHVSKPRLVPQELVPWRQIPEGAIVSQFVPEREL